MPTYSTYEAKAKFSELLRKVRAGERVTITYHGEEVAELRPLEKPASPEERWRALEARGIVEPPRGAGPRTGSRAGSRASRFAPVARRPGALERFLESRE